MPLAKGLVSPVDRLSLKVGAGWLIRGGGVEVPSALIAEARRVLVGRGIDGGGGVNEAMWSYSVAGDYAGTG